MKKLLFLTLILFVCITVNYDKISASSCRLLTYKQAEVEKGFVYVLGTVLSVELQTTHISSGNKMEISTYLVTVQPEKLWGISSTTTFSFLYDINLNFTPNKPKEMLGKQFFFGVNKINNVWEENSGCSTQFTREVTNPEDKAALIKSLDEQGVGEINTNPISSEVPTNQDKVVLTNSLNEQGLSGEYPKPIFSCGLTKTLWEGQFFEFIHCNLFETLRKIHRLYSSI